MTNSVESDILPEITFEIQEWDFTDEDEEEAEAADVLRVFGDMEHDPEMIAALLEVARVCKRIGDRRVQEERLRFMASGRDDA